MSSSGEMARDTLALLQERLRRVDYVLNGYSEPNGEPRSVSEQRASASAQLRRLERSLQSLTNTSPAAANVLQLQRSYPWLLGQNLNPSTPLAPATLFALVLAHSSLYNKFSAQLSLLSETPVPDPAPLARLAELRLRIQKARQKQEEQLKELAELRARSARVVETWYEDGVLEMGERWADWEAAMAQLEVIVRRQEAAKKREEGMA